VSSRLAHNILADLSHLAVPVSDLVLDPKPHRRHPREEIAHLKASLSRYGQDQPLVVQREGMIVRIGNGRLKAARELGWTHVAAIILDREEAEMVARGILDNRVADMARSDNDVIAELLSDLQEVDSTLPVGFDDSEIAQLLDHLGGMRGLEEEPPEKDDEPPDTDGIEAGSAWRLGDHALLCGDSGDWAGVARAFEVAGVPAADQLVTDPPYGVAYGGKTGRTIANDQGLDYRAFFGTFLRLAPMAKKNTAYIFMSGQELHNLRLALDDAGFTWGDYLVWVKQQPVLGRKDHNAAHEFVAYAWKGSHKFYGQAGKASTVLSFDRPVASADHPTMKPTDLLVRLIRDGSAPGAVVYDPFLGSGSTLIACEMAGRRCVGIELEPMYCASTVRRWERFTGLSAVRLD
jgi:DNA modification methylase